MSQSNYNIPNQSAPAVRAQLNSVFGSIATNNSGSAAPSTTFAHQWWYDTTTNILRQRNAANSAWIDIGTFDQTGGTFTPAGQRDLASQAEAEAGTDNTKLMTPLRTAQAVAAPIATLAAGDVGAPRLFLGALERLVAGTNARTTALSASNSRSDTGTVTAVYSVDFIQAGTIRVVISHSGSTSNRQTSVQRVRAGATTTVLSAATTTPRTVDLTVIPGDTFNFIATGSATSSGGSISVSVILQTDGSDLIPAEGLYGSITGNRAIT
jgi:hypothetical protein